MYEIYAYGNNDTLYGIFNAIAAIMGSNSYVAAIAAVVFCGFVAAAVAYAFAPQKLAGWHWLASVLLVYSFLLVPKVTVGIVDKLGTQPVQVVSNVPLGVAVFGNLTSTIGNTLTELSETAFQVLPGMAQLPADLSYQKHGVLFGNTLIRRTRAIVFDDPEFRTDMVNYIHNCTMYDLADGTIDPAAFGASTDVWSLMGTPNPARFSPVMVGGVSEIRTCPAAYANLNARMPAVINLSLQKLATILNPALPYGQAITQITNQLTTAYTKTKLATAASTAADIVRQNAMINAISDSSDITGQKINDPASLLLAQGRAQATAQTNAAWMNAAKMAENALPVIRNSIEALLYALFPFVVLVLFLTQGAGTLRALQTYLVLLISIQLWPPIYAILNYMSTIASAKHIAAAAQLGGGSNGLAIVTASPIYQNTISDQAVVGLLAIGIPYIAWALVNRLGGMALSAITGVSSMQGMTAAASAPAATGNLSMGNTSMDQVNLSPNYSSAFKRTITDGWGTRTEGFAPGAEVSRWATNMSHVPTSFSFSEREATAMSDSARRSEVLAHSQRESAAKSTAAALVTAMSMQEDFSRSDERTEAVTMGTAGRDSRDVNTLLQVAENVNKQLGYEGTALAGKRIVANASAGLNVFGMGGTTAFQGGTEENERQRRAFDYAKQQLQNSGITSGTSIAESFQESDAYQWGKRSAASGAERFDSSFRESQDYTRSADKSLVEAQELARMAQFMREISTNISSDASNYLVERLDATGRLGEYLRADPLTQKQMTYDIAREYARGAAGVNDEYMPYAGAGEPIKTPGSLLGFNGSLEEAYQRLGVQGGSSGEVQAAQAAWDTIIRAKQQGTGVTPSLEIQDDLSTPVHAGMQELRSHQDKEGSSILSEARNRQDDYYSGTGEATTKLWTNAASDVSDDARKVIDEVSGVNRGLPTRPKGFPASSDEEQFAKPELSSGK